MLTQEQFRAALGSKDVHVIASSLPQAGVVRPNDVAGWYTWLMDRVFEAKASYIYRTPKSGDKLEFHLSAQDKIERLVSAMGLAAPAFSVDNPTP